MGAHQAAASSQTQKAVVAKTPDPKKAVGGYFGADSAASNNALNPSNSRRATFLGA